MAFGAEELRVLRRALALALHPAPASPEEVQACLRLAESLDEAMREGARLRAFLVADLARYRAALPGAATGYLALLEEALDSGYHPAPEDLTALRALRGTPAAAALLQDVRARLAPAPADPAVQPRPVIPASRTHLLALPGGLSDGSPRTPVDLPAQAAARAAGQDPAKQPRKKPAERPAAPKPTPGPGTDPGAEPAPATPKPPRPIPTPGEVFPRRKPTPPSGAPPQQLAAG
ncbi:hypothetical protein [Streptomyces sp. V4I8]|uniref:hypothetical protein n=1 Tax=Streptomyces sp. V4I8 TaxID=3156469 RepID=UPI003515B12E